ATPEMADLRLVASSAPAFARAFLELHAAYRQTHERLASLDEALGRDDAQTQQSPWTEVRDFFHYCDNYIDAVDRAAEYFASQNHNAPGRAIEALARVGITVVNSDEGPLRRYERGSGILYLSARAAPETRRFQMLL